MPAVNPYSSVHGLRSTIIWLAWGKNIRFLQAATFAAKLAVFGSSSQSTHAGRRKNRFSARAAVSLLTAYGEVVPGHGFYRSCQLRVMKDTRYCLWNPDSSVHGLRSVIIWAGAGNGAIASYDHYNAGAITLRMTGFRDLNEPDGRNRQSMRGFSSIRFSASCLKASKGGRAFSKENESTASFSASCRRLLIHSTAVRSPFTASGRCPSRCRFIAIWSKPCPSLAPSIIRSFSTAQCPV